MKRDREGDNVAKPPHVNIRVIQREVLGIIREVIPDYEFAEEVFTDMINTLFITYYMADHDGIIRPKLGFDGIECEEVDNGGIRITQQGIERLTGTEWADIVWDGLRDYPIVGEEIDRARTMLQRHPTFQ